MEKAQDGVASDRLFTDVDDFAEWLAKLHAQREANKELNKELNKVISRERKNLSKGERAEILKKTGGRCHICGGEITGDNWEADHIVAHSTGGEHREDNYLPAHSACNNYRWDYEPEEFRWILKLGIFMRTEIENKRSIGRYAGEKFVEDQRRREARRVNMPGASAVPTNAPTVAKQPARQRAEEANSPTVAPRYRLTKCQGVGWDVKRGGEWVAHVKFDRSQTRSPITVTRGTIPTDAIGEIERLARGSMMAKRTGVA